MNESAMYASRLEKKLIEDFKQKFKDKLGYQPIVLTKVVVDKDFAIALMPLNELAAFFTPFLPTQFGQPVNLFGKSRKRELVELRMIFCYIARQMKYTCTAIGEFIGGRDHTTVLHSVATFRNLLETNEIFREKYTQILTHIKENYESPTVDESYQVQLESEPALLS